MRGRPKRHQCGAGGETFVPNPRGKQFHHLGIVERRKAALNVGSWTIDEEWAGGGGKQRERVVLISHGARVCVFKCV